MTRSNSECTEAVHQRVRDHVGTT